MYLIDSHCHLDVFADPAAVVARAQAANVKQIIAIGAGDGFHSAPKARALAQQFPGVVFASAGLHPCCATEAVDRAWLEQVCSAPEAIAIGETGIDNHWKQTPLAYQQQWFAAHIEIATQLQKPLIIHSRQGTELSLQQLSQADRSLTGVFHCYTDEVKFVEQILELGFYLSFTGIVTFAKARNVQDAVVATPLDRLLLETDAPFLAPEPFRGKECEPAMVPYTAQKIATLKGVSIEELAEITTRNVRRLFKIPA